MKRFAGTIKPWGGALRWPLYLLLLGVLIMPVHTAWAQAEDEEVVAEAPSETEEVAEEQAGVFKGETVVTSRRREENIQEVPIAVSVIAGEVLEDVVAHDISELVSYVPNLSIYHGRNQSTTLTAFIRGIGQADPLWGVDPGVGLYINDVYIARPQGALLDVFDVGRVEVLRGPQGTLYGKNTIGGAIKYVSKEITDKPEGTITYNPGTLGTQEFRAGFGGALIPGKLRAKASFAKLTHDGYGTNHYTGADVSDKDTTAWRVALDWMPSDDVDVKFSYDGAQDRAQPVGLTRLQGNPYCYAFLGEACEPMDNIFDTQSGLDPANGTDSYGFALNVGWAINPIWSFKSITAYRKSDSYNNIDFDTTPARIADVYATYGDEQTTQEFQLLFDAGGRWTGVFGFYYFDGEAGGVVNSIFFDSTFATTDGDTKTKSYAVYGDASYAISDRLKLNVGLRPTSEKKTGRAYNTYSSDDSFSDVTFIAADYEKSKTFTSLAPKLGLDYKFNQDVMGYFTLSQGFKSGGFNVRAQSTLFPESADPFDDETLTMAEVGVKSVLADRQLVLNAALFYGDYSDIQVSTFTSYDSDGDGMDDAFYGNFINAGDATLKGVEVEYNWSSRSWFGLSGFVAYLDAKPDTFLDENNDGFVDTQVITNAPEFTGSIRANVDFPLFGGLLTGSIGYAYRDDSVLTNEGGADPWNPTEPLLPLVQPSYGIVDAWIGWLSQSAKWRLGISAKNLTDEEYMTNGYNIPVLGVYQGSFGAPRTVVGTIEFRFF